MPRTVNFRTKLLVTLAVPVIALVTVTAFTVSDRRAAADATAQVRARIEVVAAAEGLAQEIRLEEAVSGKAVATGDRSVTALARAATDAAVAKLRAAIESAKGAGSGAFDDAVARLETNLAALATGYRSSVDFGSDTSFFLNSYNNVLTNIASVVSTVADETGDAQLSRETAALAALSRAANATAREWTILQVSFTRGAMAITEGSALAGTLTDRERWLGVYEGLATAAGAAEVRSQLAGHDAQLVADGEANALAAIADPAVRLVGDASAWDAAMRGRMTVFSDAATTQINHIDGQAVQMHNGAVDSLRRFVILAGAVVLLSVGLALALARAVTRPLRKLTAAAQDLANVRLPSLVSGLRSPSEDDQQYLVTTIQPIEIRSNDEIGRLAQAFNTVQTVAVDVAAEQAALLRKGISDIFVNLARRNQVLIDRQIEFLDDLEAEEQDPDQLSQLYRLDHLATRMRRNAESLLVLAGLEPGRNRTRPVALLDVVRAAIGEVEDYARIDLAEFRDVEVIGSAAVGLGHLLAELLENATNFSPPTSKVKVEGGLARNGYDVTVTDEGIGMNDEQLADANTVLASPPAVGLELTRSLGFTVIGRLAARFGVTVRLSSSSGRGVVAEVHIPRTLVVTQEDDEVEADDVLLVAENTVAEEWLPDWPDDDVVEEVPHATLTLAHALPQGVRFEQGLAELLQGDDRLGPASLIEPPVATRPPVTSSGLVKRQPKPTNGGGEWIASGEPSRPVIAAGRRSPDEVRDLLARYRTGLQRGRGSDASVEESEEPS